VKENVSLHFLIELQHSITLTICYATIFFFLHVVAFNFFKFLSYKLFYVSVVAIN
jgi:hypothetical protein